MIPPMLLRLRVNGFGIWLPLILLWPLALLFAPLVVLVALLALQPIRGLCVYYNLLCSLRGLQVHVRQPGNNVDIQVR
jgi:hypothetical protein